MPAPDPTPDYDAGFPPALTKNDILSKGDDVEVNFKWIQGLYDTATGNILWYYGDRNQFHLQDIPKLKNFGVSDLVTYLPLEEPGFYVYLIIYLVVCLGTAIIGCRFCCRTGCKCCCKAGKNVDYWGKTRVGVARSQPGGVNVGGPSTQPSKSPSSVKESEPVDVENAGETAEPGKSEGTLDESVRVDTQNTGGGAKSEGTLKESVPADATSSGAPTGQSQGIRRSLENGKGKVQAMIKGREPLILTVLMGIWLFLWFLVVIYSFGAPGFALQGTETVHDDILNGFHDAEKFLDKSIEEMAFMYHTNFEKFEKALTEVYDACDPAYAADCKRVKDNSNAAMDSWPGGVRDSLKVKTWKDFNDKLVTIRDSVIGAKNTFKLIVEDVFTPATIGLFGLLVFMNILSLFSFVAVLAGLILAWVGKSDKQKTAGHLAMRGGITAMFTLSTFIFIVLIVIFLWQGMIISRFCPNVIEVSEDNSTQLDINGGPYNGEYVEPKFADAMGSCKRNEPVFQALNLFTVRSPEMHKAKLGDFHTQLNPLENEFKAAGKDSAAEATGKRNPYNTIMEIHRQAENYITGALVRHITTKASKCEIIYKALYTLISLFCLRLPGPMLGYWFVLQFVPFLFVLMIVTAYFFERFHFK